MLNPFPTSVVNVAQPVELSITCYFSLYVFEKPRGSDSFAVSTLDSATSPRATDRSVRGPDSLAMSSHRVPANLFVLMPLSDTSDQPGLKHVSVPS